MLVSEIPVNRLRITYRRGPETGLTYSGSFFTLLNWSSGSRTEITLMAHVALLPASYPSH